MAFVTGQLSVPIYDPAHPNAAVSLSNTAILEAAQVKVLNGYVYVGNSNAVSPADGFPLAKGEQIELTVKAADNGSKIFLTAVDADNSGSASSVAFVLA